MTPAEIIQRTRVPGTKSVFFLGCFEKRVTVLSQQVRALNLVAAIHDQNLVREKGGKVAIVGAGAAGITAAVALVRAYPELKAVHLFEKRTDLLLLQQQSNRYLHPHNYDWPAAGSDNPCAGLPILNWQAGPAGKVHRQLRKAFELASRGTVIAFRSKTEVTGVIPGAYESARVVLNSAAYPSEIYDVVILSVGFGLEKSAKGDTMPYWSSWPLETPILGPGMKEVFVSGNGDGGLVDFMRAAFQPMPHQELCQFLTGLDLGLARDELEQIEAEAWAPGANVDLYQAYRARLPEVLPQGVITNVGERLRPDVRVRLHTNEPRLFKRESAVLNRLGCTLVLMASEDFAPGRLTTAVGVEFDGPVPLRGRRVKLVGEAAKQTDYKFLRIGPDAEENLEPFKALVDRMPPAAKTPSGTTRPATPTLSAEAIALFGAEPGPDNLDEAPPALAEDVVSLRLERGHAGEILTSGDLPVAQIGEIWRQGRQVSVDCGWPPYDAPRLVDLLARLCGHAIAAVVWSDYRGPWEKALAHALRPHALPANLNLRVHVEPGRTLPAAVGAVAVQPDAFVEAGHAALDAECLRMLDDELRQVIGCPDPADCGWPIEPALRAELWALWETWRATLQDDPAVLRRFLVLLADESDAPGLPESGLVRVGPRTIRAHLLKPALFGLAFVLGSHQDMGPAPGHPGNLQGPGGAGHACGVNWIEGRNLSSRVAERVWTTPVVLLSELQVALDFLRPAPRLDEVMTPVPLLADLGAHERPLIMGADEAFRDALEQGRPALDQYLAEILDRRAEAAGMLIEGPSA